MTARRWYLLPWSMMREREIFWIYCIMSRLYFHLQHSPIHRAEKIDRTQETIRSHRTLIWILISNESIHSVYSWCTVSIGGIEQRIICDARHARIAGVHDQRSHFRCGNLTPDISGVKIPSHAFKQKRYYSNSCVCLLSIVLSIVRILFHTSLLFD